MSTELENWQNSIKADILSCEKEKDVAEMEYLSTINSKDAQIGGQMYKDAAERIYYGKISIIDGKIARLEEQLIKLNPKDFYDELCNRMSSATDKDELEDLSKQFLRIDEYKDSKEKSEECNRLADEAKAKKDYIELCKQMGNATTANSLRKIAGDLRKSPYKDANKKAEECDRLADKRQTEENELSQKKKDREARAAKAAKEAHEAREAREAAERGKAGKVKILQTVITGIFVYLLFGTDVFYKLQFNNAVKNSNIGDDNVFFLVFLMLPVFCFALVMGIISPLLISKGKRHNGRFICIAAIANAIYITLWYTRNSEALYGFEFDYGDSIGMCLVVFVGGLVVGIPGIMLGNRDGKHK